MESLYLAIGLGSVGAAVTVLELAQRIVEELPPVAEGVVGEDPTTIVDAAHHAFIAGLSRGSLVCCCVVLMAAVFASVVLPHRLPDKPSSPNTGLPERESL